MAITGMLTQQNPLTPLNNTLGVVAKAPASPFPAVPTSISPSQTQSPGIFSNLLNTAGQIGGQILSGAGSVVQQVGAYGTRNTANPIPYPYTSPNTPASTVNNTTAYGPPKPTGLSSTVPPPPPSGTNIFSPEAQNAFKAAGYTYNSSTGRYDKPTNTSSGISATQSGTKTEVPPAPANSYKTDFNQGNPQGTDPTFLGSLGALGNIGNQGSEGYNKAIQNLADYNKELGQKYADMEQSRVPLTYTSGKEAVLARQAAYQQSTLQNAINQQQTQQGAQIGALTSVAGMTKPIQYGLIMDPATGQMINQGSANSAIDSAMQLFNSGTPLNDPRYAQVLAPLGPSGPMLFIQALQQKTGGNFNPAAQSATQEQNISYGQMTLQQAQALNTPLTTLKTLQPQILDVLGRGQINPTNIPAWNAQIGTYLSQFAPDAVNQWQTIANEIKVLGSQILAARSPGTPTTQDEMIAAQDPSKLSAAQLTTVLNTWDSLGGTVKGVLQGISKDTLGSGGYSGSQGFTTPIPQATDTSGLQSPLGQGAAGAAMNFGPALMGLGASIWGIIKGVLPFI